MIMTGCAPTNTVIPYWNVIKNWSREDRSNLAELLEVSLKEEENTDMVEFTDQLSPELMQGLAECAIKEHRAGHCLTTNQVEQNVMEAMGW